MRDEQGQEKTKHTIWLYKGDMHSLQEIYGDVGASAVIRRILREHLAQYRTREGKLKVGLRLPGAA